jgi:hypothetical protein
VVNAHDIVVTIFELGVTFLVPAFVWITLVVGLLQLAIDGIRRLGVVLPDTQRVAQRSAR